MRHLFILKTGSTAPEISRVHGDFEHWIIAGMEEAGLPVLVRDVSVGASIPEWGECLGVVVTGSPAMVTDKLPWSVALEQWLPKAVAAAVPVLGICYGHQLLAESLGGLVNDHPRGKEIGTVSIGCTSIASADPLFAGLPVTFKAHVTHMQSVLRLPPEAVLLAGNDFEPHQAFRVGQCAWGVQFHPEFTADIMRAYIEYQHSSLLAMGLQPDLLLRTIQDTAWPDRVLRAFANYVGGQKRLSKDHPA